MHTEHPFSCYAALYQDNREKTNKIIMHPDLMDLIAKYVNECILQNTICSMLENTDSIKEGCILG